MFFIRDGARRAERLDVPIVFVGFPEGHALGLAGGAAHLSVVWQQYFFVPGAHGNVSLFRDRHHPPLCTFAR